MVPTDLQVDFKAMLRLIRHLQLLVLSMRMLMHVSPLDRKASILQVNRDSSYPRHHLRPAVPIGGDKLIRQQRQCTLA
jgi:hypothetical protein